MDYRVLFDEFRAHSSDEDADAVWTAGAATARQRQSSRQLPISP